MRRWLRSGALFLLSLFVAVPLVVSSATAHADDFSWRPGWCHRDEGIAIVIDFRTIPPSVWPPGNHLGYDVRCLYGPGIANLSLTSAISLFALPSYAGVPTTVGPSGLYEFWGIKGGFYGRAGSVEGGWGTAPANSPGNKNFFASLTIATAGLPVVVPQFLNDAGGGNVPNMNPGVQAPADNGAPAPATVAAGAVQQPGGANPPAGGGGGAPAQDLGAQAAGGGAPAGQASASPSASATPSASAAPQASAPAAETPSASASASRVFPPETPGASVDSTGSRSGGPAPWVWVLVGVAGLAMAGAGVWFWLRQAKTAKERAQAAT